MNRGEILDTAKLYVGSDRNVQYGGPERNFERIAAMWSAYLGVKMEPHDVAAMQVMVKLSRLVTSPNKMDNWVDIAGYAACGGEVAGDASSGS